MQTSLRRIARKAKQNKKHRFGNLYGMLDKAALYQAWRDINKKAAAGVDKMTDEEFGINLEENLEVLLDELTLPTPQHRYSQMHNKNILVFY